MSRKKKDETKRLKPRDPSHLVLERCKPYVAQPKRRKPPEVKEWTDD